MYGFQTSIMVWWKVTVTLMITTIVEIVSTIVDSLH